MILKCIVRRKRNVMWLSGSRRVVPDISDNLDKGSEKEKSEPIPGDRLPGDES
jgi:hypothetical protein